MKKINFMKHFLNIIILMAGLLFLTSGVQAQQKGKLCLSGLLGTYTFTGNALQDMSEINPSLPEGYAPVTLIGTFTVNRYGDITGWAAVNAGGISFTAEFVDSHLSVPNNDGSFAISLLMRVSYFEGIIEGPYSYIGVITDPGPSQEIAFMMLGEGPGSHLELSHAKRISMKCK